MPRSQGTSRKGKPKKQERAAGMGRALEKSTNNRRFRPKSNGSSRGSGMAMTPGVQSIGISNDNNNDNNIKSVLEMDDLADFLGQAELANREFVSEREQFVLVDPTGTEYRPESHEEGRVSWAAGQPPKKQNDFVFAELSVPRRPAWDANTTAEQLDQQEREAFLDWRRGIAAREEALLAANHNSRVTPFEKNLQVWRQLWRVLERCSCILQIVDARNPLFYLSKDLRKYATEELGRPMLLLVNKSDYLSKLQRREWHVYLKSQGWDHLFFSAHAEQAKLDAAARNKRHENVDEDDGLQDSSSPDDIEIKEECADIEDQIIKPPNQSTRENPIGIEEPLTRQELLDWLHAFAVQYHCEPDPRFDNRIQFGMVGFPNVGKSSVINVLVGSSKHAHGVARVAVAAQPGKTKHFQTLLLPDRDDIMLCDCPGLVFPSFVSNTADLIAAGVYPIAQMRDHWPVVELICRRIPREILNAVYGIQLPVPTAQELKERGWDEPKLPPPTAEELLSTYCVARGMLAAASGVPDCQKASRIVIKDYAEGKLLYCHAPPSSRDGDGTLGELAFHKETVLTALHNTKKLRDKLGVGLEDIDLDGSAPVRVEREDTDKLADDDLDILESVEGLMGTTDNNEHSNGGKRGKKHKSMKKWGRKGRKDRNKDPYGCHSSPDDLLGFDVDGSHGVVVNAGKYGRKGYTRPTSYGGARSASSEAQTASS